MTILSPAWQPWIAAATPDVGGPLVRTPGYATDILLVLGAGLALFAVLMIWVRFGRRRPNKHDSHARKKSRHGSRRTSDHKTAAEGDEPSRRRGSHRRRRRSRRSHRERNPTLAETGGLPPPRPADSPPEV